MDPINNPMNAQANPTSVLGNVSPMISMEDLTDLETFPEYNNKQDPHPHKYHCTKHCEHVTCTKLRTRRKRRVPDCTCYLSAQQQPENHQPTDYDIQAAIVSIKSGKETLVDCNKKAEIRIYKADFDKALSLIYENDVFGEAQLCSTSSFKTTLTVEEGREIARSVHEDAIDGLERAFSNCLPDGRTMRKVSPFILKEEFAYCLGTKLLEFFKAPGRERFLDVPSLEAYISGQVGSVAPQCPFLDEIYKAWTRVVYGLIDVLVGIDERRGDSARTG